MHLSDYIRHKTSHKTLAMLLDGTGYCGQSITVIPETMETELVYTPQYDFVNNKLFILYFKKIL